MHTHTAMDRYVCAFFHSYETRERVVLPFSQFSAYYCELS